MYSLYIQVDEKVSEYYEKFADAANDNVMSRHPDSGMDLAVADDVSFQEFGSGKNTNLVSMGIKCAAYKTTADNIRTPTSFYMYARSSIYKTPFRLANNVGIIDSGYRGTLKAALDNMTNEPQTICVGKSIMQICMPDLSPFTVKIVDNLDETERGDGGFGSTNI